MIGSVLLLLAAAQEQAWRLYVNARYSYEICYPGFMEAGRKADSGDGREFTARDGGSLRVFASYNAADLTLPEAAAQRAQYFADRGGKVSYKATRSDWAVFSGMAGSEVFYSKTYLRDDRLLTFEVSYPKVQSVVYAPVVARLGRCFIPRQPRQ